MESFRKLSTTKKLLIPVGVVTVGLAAYQGVTFRLAYKNGIPLGAPSGPQSGIEDWLAKLREIQEDVLNNPTVQHKIKDFKDMKDQIPILIDETMHEITEEIVERVPHAKELKQKLDKYRRAYQLHKLESRSEGEVSVHTAAEPAPPSDEEVLGLLCDLLKLGNDSVFPLPISRQMVEPDREVELIVIGDSLVAGVGCSKVLGASPILPQTLASLLSYLLQREVKWRCAGKIGATARDLRQTVWPAVQQTLEQELKESNEPAARKKEYIVVVICGLNDWRILIERFPLGLGPFGFRTELQTLLGDIHNYLNNTLPIKQLEHENSTMPGRAKSGDKHAPSVTCSFFLPRLPLDLLGSDPDCPLSFNPVRSLFWSMCAIWDHQKRRIQEAFRNETRWSMGVEHVEETVLDHHFDSTDEDSDLQVFAWPTSSSQRRTSVSSFPANLQRKLQHQGFFSPRNRIMCLSEPVMTALYATPGRGNVSADLVHPSDHAYRWWATHLAEVISLSYKSDSGPADSSS